MNELNVSLQHSITTLAGHGWSHRKIARELGVHRETVGRYLRGVESAAKPISGTGRRDLYFDLSPTVAADLLDANAQVLQAQSLQQGKTAEQAAGELKAVLRLLRELTLVSFTSTQHVNRWELELRGGWK